MSSKEKQLVRAIENGDVATVRTLLTKDARYQYGWYVLYRASELNDAQIVELLLEANADPNEAHKNGQTPLHRAARNSQLPIVDLLLKANANPNAADKDGETALHEASRSGNLGIVNLLLKAKADPNAADLRGETALHEAFRYGYVPVIDVLLKANANPNAARKSGGTALHEACSEGRVQAVEVLLKAKADPNAAGEMGLSPLHMASFNGHFEVVKLLLKNSANPNAVDEDEREPLHCCISKWAAKVTNKRLKTLQVLVSFGATWNAACDEMVDDGWTSKVARWMGSNREAHKEAPALRVCMLLWTEEHTSDLPFTDIPFEVVQRGAESTQSWIDSFKASREIVHRHKICLVGSSCAGKTSLIKSITSETPQLVHLDDRTIGIDHFPLHFHESNDTSDQTKIHEVTFWDFAGQDAYQVAHSLFFSPRTMFLLCIDLDAFILAYKQAVILADEETHEIRLLDEVVDDSVMVWMRMIIARQPDAEFMFIATKEDVLTDNKVTEQLLKEIVKAKLKQVEAITKQMKDQEMKDKRLADAKLMFTSQISVGEATTEPTIVWTSCTSPAFVKAAKAQVKDLVIRSKHGIQMPEIYSHVLAAIVEIRKTANSKPNNITTRINCVFAPVDTLPSKLKIGPKLCRNILRNLHDLGDVLWYEDLGVELFQNTVILEPLLLIDFIRQVITHKHTGVTISHRDLRSKPFWMGLSSEEQMEAMKQVLYNFHLVYPDDASRVMQWNTDLIVPAYWQTKTPARWLFLGDILRINTTKSRDEEAVRVHWEYDFEYGLPLSLFDYVVVASVAPYIAFDAGPDWIVYENKKVAACRIMIGRDRKSRHRTIRVEAVVAAEANAEQVDMLWKHFRHLCGAFVWVLREFPGLTGVSSTAWDDKHNSHNLKRLLQASYDDSSAKWMPPAATMARLKKLATESMQLESHASIMTPLMVKT